MTYRYRCSDPNSLFSQIANTNSYVRDLREQGWTVKLGLAEGGARIFVEVSASRSCDPPEREEEQ